MATTASYSDTGKSFDQRRDQNVIVDNGVLTIEELRPPDKPTQRELRDYVDKATRSIHPETGDQVVYRLKESNSGNHASVVQSDVWGPQVAVLGSPQVPVGLSSALGYLQLGQLARVTLPADLMEQAVADTDAGLQSLPSTPKQSTTPTAEPTTTPKAKTLAVPTEVPAAAAGYKPPPAAAAADSNADAAPLGVTSSGSSDPAAAAAAAAEYPAIDRSTGGIVPPQLPLLSKQQQQQQTLRERFSPQQQGLNTTDSGSSKPLYGQSLQHQHSQHKLAYTPQQIQQGLVPQASASQPHTGPVLYGQRPAPAAAAAGCSGDVVQRADSDSSSWLPDSRNSSMRGSLDPAASTTAAAGGGGKMTHPVRTSMPLASGWSSGASSPRSGGQSPTAAAANGSSGSTAFHTPGGSRYHTATSVSRNSSTSSAGIPAVNARSANLKSNNVASNNSADQVLVGSPQQCLSPEMVSSPDLAHKAGRPAAADLAKPQQQQQGLAAGPADARVLAAKGHKGGLKPSMAFQTPDQVLQAAAKRLEEEQQQQQQQQRSSSAARSAAAAAGSVQPAASSVSSLVSAKRPPAAPAAATPPRLSSDSSDGAAGTAAARSSSNAPSFKTWIPGRAASTSGGSSAIMTSVAEEQSHPAAAAAASGGITPDQVLRQAAVRVSQQQQQQQQQEARVSIDRKMRYSGDYGSFRQSQDGGGDHPAAAGSSNEAAAGSSGNAAANGDAAGSSDQDANKKEYELEVLAIIPGRGKLSGKPVLSESAQQHDNLDINQLTKQVAKDEPQFKPPKPQKGFKGWCRRHLSVNLRSPASAAKRGGDWLGVRGCFKGAKDKHNRPSH